MDKALSDLSKKDEPAPPRGVIAVDPAIDGNTGQQTLASKYLDSRLLQRAADKFAQFDVVPVSSSSVPRAQYLLAGTLTPLDASGSTRGSFRINLSLTDIKTGFVVAQSVARVRGDGVDTTPTPFYRDSPSLTKDRVVEGQIRTAQAPTGSSADEVYLSRIPINALISEASKLYEAGNYAEALRYYEAAAARPEGQQLRVFNGLYLANTQLGRADDAEKAFAKIVALGLATNSLSVKFLYRPGSLEFLADPKISGPYNMWVRLIAREVSRIEGRASRSSATRAGRGPSSSTSGSRCNERSRCSAGSRPRLPRRQDACNRSASVSARISSDRAPTICATRSIAAWNSRFGPADRSGASAGRARLASVTRAPRHFRREQQRGARRAEVGDRPCRRCRRRCRAPACRSGTESRRAA